MSVPKRGKRRQRQPSLWIGTSSNKTVMRTTAVLSLAIMTTFIHTHTTTLGSLFAFGFSLSHHRLSPLPKQTGGRGECPSWGCSSCIISRQTKTRIFESFHEEDQDSYDDNDTDNDDDIANDEDMEPPQPSNLDEEMSFSRNELMALTNNQLKQQLRLRGLKVSGRKAELINRLLGPLSNEVEVLDVNGLPENAANRKERQDNTPIDVTAYLDEDDKNRRTRSVGNTNNAEEPEDAEEGDGNPEAWGSSAQVVQDYDERNIIVDGLSRTVIEYQGSNQTKVQAYVVASRDALRKFMAGGERGMNQTLTPEFRLRQLQSQREEAGKSPKRPEDTVRGREDPNDPMERVYEKVMDRDFTDWGVYTPTGAQISAEEVQAVLLLSDVYGPFTEDTKLLADKIAFECQPVVVMVPDLFRGKPWQKGKNTVSETNDKGQTYEEWRALHNELQVSVDIRAAASCLKTRYGCNAVAVWGTCYGGGRALEAAAGYFPNGNIHDVDGRVGPPPVDPLAAVAWYPTRYNAPLLFGKDHKGSRINVRTGKQRKEDVAVMAIFAEEDDIAGATPDDAATLQSLLGSDSRIKDHMVKVFPRQVHGFAHVGLADHGNSNGGGSDMSDLVDEDFGGPGSANRNSGDAEVASLLSTAWMETYTREFLPTVGVAVKDEEGTDWTSLAMKDLSDSNTRDIRQEIDNAMSDYEKSRDESTQKNISSDDEDQIDFLGEHDRTVFEEMLRRTGHEADTFDRVFGLKEIYMFFQNASENGLFHDLPDSQRIIDILAQSQHMEKKEYSLDGPEEGYW